MADIKQLITQMNITVETTSVREQSRVLCEYIQGESNLTQRDRSTLT